MSAPTTPALTGPIHVVGTGLLGTSVGLAARRAGLEVWLSDASPEHVRTASGLGAGTPAPQEGTPQLTVVAVPPAAIPAAVLEALARGGVVTDVGSVKGEPLAAIEAGAGESVARYVGSHPMAGSERSGPLAASEALFDGRPWAVTPHAYAAPDAIALVEQLARLCGAEAVLLSPHDHDLAVARVSHLPHLLAVLTAGRLAEAAPDHLALSGQGVRDVTRVAGGDPALWSQILGANRAAVASLLGEVRGELDRLLGAVESGDGDALGAILARGVAGTRAIPGKHGGPALPMDSVHVAVPDHPGELARLFADVGEIGVNVEDLYIDHDQARPVGQVELIVRDSAAEGLRHALAGRGWTVSR